MKTFKQDLLISLVATVVFLMFFTSTMNIETVNADPYIGYNEQESNTYGYYWTRFTVYQYWTGRESTSSIGTESHSYAIAKSYNCYYALYAHENPIYNPSEPPTQNSLRIEYCAVFKYQIWWIKYWREQYIEFTLYPDGGYSTRTRVNAY